MSGLRLRQSLARRPIGASGHWPAARARRHFRSRHSHADQL